MLYPFIYLRVYYRGFQDYYFQDDLIFSMASRGYHRWFHGHGPSVLAGPRSKFCGLHSPPHPLGHGLAGVSRQRLYHGWWSNVVFFWEVSNLSNDPMLCFFSRLVFGRRMTMTMMIWLMMIDDDWWIWIRQEPRPPHFQGGDPEGSWFFTKGHFGSLCGVQRATGLVLVASVTF